MAAPTSRASSSEKTLANPEPFSNRASLVKRFILRCRSRGLSRGR